MRSVTNLPIVIKGIQCVDDAVLAAEAGVDGILISNHGGRCLNDLCLTYLTSMSPVDYQQSYGPPYSAGVDPAFNFGNSVYQPNYDVLASNPNPDTFLHDASQPVLDWTRFSNAPGAFQGQQYSGYAQPSTLLPSFSPLDF